MGGGNIFFMFGAIQFIATGFIYMYMKETKGLTEA